MTARRFGQILFVSVAIAMVGAGYGSYRVYGNFKTYIQNIGSDVGHGAQDLGEVAKATVELLNPLAPKIVVEVNRSGKGDRTVDRQPVPEYFGPYRSFDISRRI